MRTGTATRRHGVPSAAGGPARDTIDGDVGGRLGHTTEDDTGLIYMRARYYDPAIGRFISEDPAGNGDNWYAYCDNNPVNLVDESGNAAAPAVAERLLVFALAMLGIEAGESNILHKSHPFVSHVLQLMGCALAAYQATAAMLMAAAKMDDYNTPRGQYTAAAAAATLGLLASVMVFCAVEQLALAILLVIDPGGHDVLDEAAI